MELRSGTMKIILYIWQLPQNLLGLLLLAFHRLLGSEYKVEKRDGCVVYRMSSMRGGISLGRYIIVSYYMSEKNVLHELGHAFDSRKFGWLYLLVIGLPSLWWAITYRDGDYFSFWTERRADKYYDIKR